MPDGEAPGRQVLEGVLDDHLRRKLLSIASGVVHDPAVAEDVVQDVLAAASRESSPCNKALHLESYLRVSVRNEARKRVRRRARRKARRRGIDVETVAARRASASKRYFFELEIPSKLSRHLRPIYFLWYQGMTQEEIAVVLGISRSTIKRRWSEILATLRNVVGAPPKFR